MPSYLDASLNADVGGLPHKTVIPYVCLGVARGIRSILKDPQLCQMRPMPRATLGETYDLRKACFRSPRAAFSSNSDLNKDNKPTFLTCPPPRLEPQRPGASSFITHVLSSLLEEQELPFLPV